MKGPNWKLPMDEEEFYWKIQMEEALEAFLLTAISSRGPNHCISGNDMHLISDGNNNDTKSNGRGVTNGYAFGSDMNRLTGTPD